LTEATAPLSAQPDCARLVYEAEQAPIAVNRSSKKPRGLDHLKEIQPPAEANAYAAQLRKVRYGPATLDAFLMPDGSFRFSMRSAAASVHMLSNSQAQRTIERVVQGNMPEPGPAQIPVIAGDPAASTPCPGPLLLDVPFAGPAGYATTMDHQTLIRFWGELSRTSRTYGPAAVRMLEIGAEVSLIALCQQAFGIVDHRSVEERLLEAWIDLGTERPEPLFDAQFRQFYESVVGHRWGSPATASCLADLVSGPEGDQPGDQAGSDQQQRRAGRLPAAAHAHPDQRSCVCSGDQADRGGGEGSAGDHAKGTVPRSVEGPGLDKPAVQMPRPQGSRRREQSAPTGACPREVAPSA
jgi:hypothetical protein